MHPSSWFTILLVSIKMIYRSTKYQILSPCDICTKSNLCNESSFNRFFVYIHFLYLPRNELQLGQLCFTSFKELMQKGIQQKHQTIGRVNNLKKRIRIHAKILLIFFLTMTKLNIILLDIFCLFIKVSLPSTKQYSTPFPTCQWEKCWFC